MVVRTFALWLSTGEPHDATVGTLDERAHPDPVKAETTGAAQPTRRTAGTRSFGERGLRRGPEEPKRLRIHDWQQHRWRSRARA